MRVLKCPENDVAEVGRALWKSPGQGAQEPACRGNGGLVLVGLSGKGGISVIQGTYSRGYRV